jgi:hypothetical protein
MQFQGTPFGGVMLLKLNHIMVTGHWLRSQGRRDLATVNVEIMKWG